MAWLTVLTLLAAVLSVSSIQRYADDNIDNGESGELQQKYKVIVNEVEDLRETVKILKDDMKRMKRISRALDALCEELNSEEQNLNLPDSVETTIMTSTTTVTSSPTTHGAETADVLSTPIQVVSMKTNNKTFKVEYESAIKAKVIELDYSTDEKKGPHALHETFSSGEGSVNGTIPSRDFGVHLSVKDYTSSVYMTIYNSTEVDLPPLDMTVNVQEEIVFDPGQSVEIKVKTNKSDSDDFHLYFAYRMLFVSKNESNTVVSVRSTMPGIINRTDVQKHSDFEEHNVIINKNKGDNEGMAIFLVDAVSKNPSPVTSFSLTVWLNVRRSDHVRPFPADFLGFVSYSDGYNDIRCSLQTVCSLYPRIVGNDPGDISLWRISNGHRQKLNVPSKKYFYKNTVIVQFRISNISTSDEGRYLYQGVSKSGKFIEKEIELRVTLRYKLLQEKSEVLKDTEEELVVRCVGQGYPDPEIRFYNSSGYWEERYISERPGVSLETQKENDTMISVTLTVDQHGRYTRDIYCLVRMLGDDSNYDGFRVYSRV